MKKTVIKGHFMRWLILGEANVFFTKKSLSLTVINPSAGVVTDNKSSGTVRAILRVS